MATGLTTDPDGACTLASVLPEVLSEMSCVYDDPSHRCYMKRLIGSHINVRRRVPISHCGVPAVSGSMRDTNRSLDCAELYRTVYPLAIISNSLPIGD